MSCIHGLTNHITDYLSHIIKPVIEQNSNHS